VGSAFIVIYAPAFNNIPGIFQTNKPVLVQAFIPEPARIEKKVALNDSQQNRLLTLFGKGDIDQAIVMDKLAQLKREKEELEANINKLSKSVEQKIDLKSARERLREYCSRVRDNLNNYTFQEKKQTFYTIYRFEVQAGSIICDCDTTASSLLS